MHFNSFNIEMRHLATFIISTETVKSNIMYTFQDKKMHSKFN